MEAVLFCSGTQRAGTRCVDATLYQQQKMKVDLDGEQMRGRPHPVRSVHTHTGMQPNDIEVHCSFASLLIG